MKLNDAVSLEDKIGILALNGFTRRFSIITVICLKLILDSLFYGLHSTELIM